MNVLFRFVLLLCVAEKIVSNRGQSNERRLIQNLINNYTQFGKMSRPVKDESALMHVEFGLVLIQIVDFDERQQILTLSVWCKYKWTDSYLTWNQADYGRISQIRISTDLIWKPDIMLYNSIDMQQGNVLAVLMSDGTVTWIPPTTFKFACQTDATAFPYDKHTCTMKFGSWTYNGNRIDPVFFGQMTDIEMEDYVPSNEWEIVEQHAKKSVIFYDCCPNEPFPDLKFTLTLRRSGAFYSYIFIMPYFVLTLLAVIMFLLPPESPGKISVGVGITASFYLLLLLLKEKMPPVTTNIPVIGTFYCIHLIITAIWTLLSACIVNLHFGADKRNSPPIRLKQITVDLLAPNLHIKIPRKTHQRNQESGGAVANDQEVLISKSSLERNDLQQQQRQIIASCQPLFIALGREIRMTRQLIEQCVERTQQQRSTAADWILISRVFDRLFFFIYIACAVISTLTFTILINL